MIRVMMVGLDPRVVDFGDPAYAAFPDLDERSLQTALDRDLEALRHQGYDASMALWDKTLTAEDRFVAALIERKPACVMIGAGVRFNPTLTPLFEKLVNLVRTHSTESKLCFNSGPFDSAEAIERQLAGTGTDN